jgi:large subunit ribosomal protein L25
MEYHLNAAIRGNEDVDVLRDAGKLPGVLYGNKVETRKVVVDLKEFDKVFRKASIHHVITLQLDGKPVDTLVRQINLNKRKRLPEHVDFYLVSDAPVNMYVGIKVIGTAQGVREGGVLQIVHTDIQVKVAPKNVPDHLEVDVSALRIGDSVHMGDLKLPAGVTLVANPKDTVVAVVPAEDMDKLAAPEGAAAEPEVIKKGKTEEK